VASTNAQVGKISAEARAAVRAEGEYDAVKALVQVTAIAAVQQADLVAAISDLAQRVAADPGLDIAKEAAELEKVRGSAALVFGGVAVSAFAVQAPPRGRPPSTPPPFAPPPLVPSTCPPPQEFSGPAFNKRVESKVTGIPDIVQNIQQQQEQLGKPEAIVGSAGTPEEQKVGLIAGTVVGVGVGLAVVTMMLIAFKKKRPVKELDETEGGAPPPGGLHPASLRGGSGVGSPRVGSPRVGSPRVGSSYAGSPRVGNSPRVGTPRSAVGTPRSAAGPIGEGDEASASAAAAFYQSRSLRAQAALRQPSSGGADPKQ
jgi:hypothetical protein